MVRVISSLILMLTFVSLESGHAHAAKFKQCASVPPSCDTKAGGWKSSEFPHAVVDGCDYFETAFQGASGQFLAMLNLPDMTEACKVHDRCYYSNAGESAEVCNRRFYEAMLEICGQVYPEPDPVTVARNRMCATWVAEIAEAVHSVAEKEENLPRARKSQEDYMSFIAKTCDLKTWDPYPCTQPRPTGCNTEGDKTCCVTRCVKACTKGLSYWEWDCPE